MIPMLIASIYDPKPTYIAEGKSHISARHDLVTEKLVVVICSHAEWAKYSLSRALAAGLVCSIYTGSEKPQMLKDLADWAFQGRLQLLYVDSKLVLKNPSFLDMLAVLKHRNLVRGFICDELHNRPPSSEPEFQPYDDISTLRILFGGLPFMCLTGILADDDQSYIMKTMRMENPVLVDVYPLMNRVTAVARPRLASFADNLVALLRDLLHCEQSTDVFALPGVIMVSSDAALNKVRNALEQAGFSAVAVRDRDSMSTGREMQQQWLTGAAKVLVISPLHPLIGEMTARYAVFYDLPLSLETFWRGAARLTANGFHTDDVAPTIVFWSMADKTAHLSHWCQHAASQGGDRLPQDRVARLYRMIQFLSTSSHCVLDLYPSIRTEGAQACCDFCSVERRGGPACDVDCTPIAFRIQQYLQSMALTDLTKLGSRKSLIKALRGESRAPKTAIHGCCANLPAAAVEMLLTMMVAKGFIGEHGFKPKKQTIASRRSFYYACGNIMASPSSSIVLRLATQLTVLSRNLRELDVGEEPEIENGSTVGPPHAKKSRIDPTSAAWVDFISRNRSPAKTLRAFAISNDVACARGLTKAKIVERIVAKGLSITDFEAFK